MSNKESSSLKLGWSDFARGRHGPGGGRVGFAGTEEELLARVRAGWADRRPGRGRTDLDEVVIVPVSPQGFVGATVLVDGTTPLHAVYERRQPGEDGFVRVTAEGEPEPVRHAAVVLYAADLLRRDGGARSGDFDWEVVCLLAGPREDEPMDPLTMARNTLEKPGGTFCAYTARQFAEAVWYWSARAAVHRPGKDRPAVGNLASPGNKVDFGA